MQVKPGKTRLPVGWRWNTKKENTNEFNGANKNEKKNSATRRRATRSPSSSNQARLPLIVTAVIGLFVSVITVDVVNEKQNKTKQNKNNGNVCHRGALIDCIDSTVELVPIF